MKAGTDDWGLLWRYVHQRDDRAFEALARRHVDLVYSAAIRRVGDRHLAEDITQAVFVILAKKAKSIGRTTPIAAWLLKTVRLVARNATKVEARRRRHEQAAQALGRAGAFSSNPTDVLIWQEIASLIDDAVLRLPSLDRRAILLRFFENRSVSDVAAELQVSEAAAKRRLGRAIDKLRRRLERKGLGVAPVDASAFAALLSDHVLVHAPAHLAAGICAAASGATSGAAVMLAKGAIQMMKWTQIKVAATMVAITTMAGVGGALACSRTTAASSKPPASQTVTLAPFAAGLDLTKAKTAEANAKTLHVVFTDSGQYEKQREEIFYDQSGPTPKLAQITTTGRLQKVHVNDQQADVSMNYVIGGNRVGIAKAGQYTLADIPWCSWYTFPHLSHDPAADKTVNGVKLRAYTSKPPPGLTTFISSLPLIWIDDSYLLRRFEQKPTATGLGASGALQWNVPINPAQFAPPSGATKINSLDYFLSKYPLKTAVFSKEMTGTTVCINRIQKSFDDELYIVTSVRASPQYQGIRLRSSLPIGYITLNGSNQASSPVFAQRLATFQQSGDRVSYWVLVPANKNQTIDHLTISVVAGPNLLKVLLASGKKTGETIKIATPQITSKPIQFATFISDFYGAASDLDPVIDDVKLMTPFEVSAGHFSWRSLPPEAISKKAYLSQTKSMLEAADLRRVK